MTEKPVPLAGVVGSPISHSKSPRLHGYWLQHYQIDGHYIPMEVQSADLREAFQTLPKIGFKGVNVTLPHKELALSLADRVSDRAAMIGAANTITFQADGSIYADNTDGFGFIENLRQNAVGWKASDGPALVLGAGGASRAVIASLLEEGAPEVRLANRTRVKADLLKDAFGPRVVVCDWHGAADATDDLNTLVNTTSLGMTGQPELKISLDQLPSTAVVSDIVYTPLVTPLLERASDRGCRIVDGLGMLLYQAVPGFERWFGRKPEVTPELRTMAMS